MKSAPRDCEQLPFAADLSPLPVEPPDPATRQRAWSITKQAAEQARAGDCGAVSTYDQEVRDLDPEFHDTVFVRDAAIKRCLDDSGL